MAEEIAARGNVLGKLLPARYILAVLGSIGMAIIYGLKVNLSVTMVAMLNHTAIRLNEQNVTDSAAAEAAAVNETSLEQLVDSTIQVLGEVVNNATNATIIGNFSDSNDEFCMGDETESKQDGKFVWSAPLQGFLLSCYFLGYIVSQIPGAYVAENFSAKWVMFTSVALNVISTLLTPILTELHYAGLIVVRIIEGIGGGATFPAMHCLIVAWAPPSERPVISTIVYVGTSLGTAISILLAGLLSDTLGWESVFYVSGGLSCIWMVLWAILTADNPNKQRFISAEERELIISSQAGNNDKHEKRAAVPWRAVFTSIPFWAILIAHCASNWGWYMFLVEIPFYMKQVLKFNVATNAINNALPFFVLLIFSTCLEKTLDKLRSTQKISTTLARKLATACSSVIPAICLLIICYIGCRQTAAAIIMGIGIASMGGMFSGFLSNHIDIAPNYAGTLVAITNTIATLPGILVPIFVGQVTHNNQNITAWRLIFFVTIALFIVEFIVFTTFGSGEVQAWNNREKGDEETVEEQNEFTPLKETGENNDKNATTPS